jgi:glycosyltransferase involved in cell wall biosynthesis
MPHFAIDGNEANVAQRVGSNVYAHELLVALEAKTRDSAEHRCTILLSSPTVDDMPSPREGWTYKVVTPRPFWTQLALPIHLFLHQKEYDAFFTPGHYAPRVSSIPYISSVMDLAFLKYPKQFRKKDLAQLKEWTRYSVKHAAKVLAISEFTQKEVTKHYTRKKKDVFVAYPALPTQKSQKETVTTAWLRKAIGNNEPYILYVGTLQPRKNLVTLVRAFEQFAHEYTKKKEQPQLVIAGKVGWLADETLSAINTSPLKERIHLLGYVSEAEKQLLYRKSTCAVLLGLYEGFGLPPLEAMAAGTIPVVSNSSSLPEVVGEAGYQVSSTSVNEIAEAFKSIFGLKAKQRGTLLKKGRQQVKAFSWDSAAERVLEALEEISTPAEK